MRLLRTCKFNACSCYCRVEADAQDSEPGLHTGEHASAEARFAAAALQLQGRDKVDREELRGLRRQMRAEKKVRRHLWDDTQFTLPARTLRACYLMAVVAEQRCSATQYTAATLARD